MFDGLYCGVMFPLCWFTLALSLFRYASFHYSLGSILVRKWYGDEQKFCDVGSNDWPVVVTTSSPFMPSVVFFPAQPYSEADILRECAD